MRAQTRVTLVAGPTSDVDLAADPSTDPRTDFALHDLANEFVPQDAVETLVTTRYLDVRVANPRCAHLHEGFVGTGSGYGYIRSDAQRSVEGEREQVLAKIQGTTMTVVPGGVQFHRNIIGLGGIFMQPCVPP